jgi:hypothetical protein
MNCFEWQNRASDYLDGALIGTAKREADDHLEGCKDCNERHKHYRLILTSVASQPRSSLPIPIRKAPFAVALPRLDMARLGRSRWEQIPWYIRTTLEGTSIVFLILLGISAGPKVRALYERNIERNLSEFTESLSQNDSSAETAVLNLPLSRGKTAAAASSSGQEGAPGPGDVTQDGDEFASEGNENDADDSAEGTGTVASEMDVRVGNSEIWRFNLKTDSPHEMRPKIVQLLTDLKVAAGTPGLGGIEAPGGIQFDLLLSQSVVAPLKKQLQKLAPPTPEGLAGSPAGETFTWYKNKSKAPVASGQTHVVIWLSQM